MEGTPWQMCWPTGALVSVLPNAPAALLSALIFTPPCPPQWNRLPCLPPWPHHPLPPQLYATAWPPDNTCTTQGSFFFSMLLPLCHSTTILFGTGLAALYFCWGRPPGLQRESGLLCPKVDDMKVLHLRSWKVGLLTSKGPWRRLRITIDLHATEDS